MEISFTIAKGKTIGMNKNPTKEPTNFSILVSGFKTKPRTIETLATLLSNNISIKITPKSFSTPKDKYITINNEPKFDKDTRDVIRNWIKKQDDKTRQWIDLGTSTEPNSLWSQGGWGKSDASDPKSDVWNWFNNDEIENGDLYSYVNNLLKDYKYFGENYSLSKIYFYWRLSKEFVDTTSDPNISVYKWVILPEAFGLKVTNNGVETTTLMDNIQIPSAGDYIKNSYLKSQAGQFEICFKKQAGIPVSETGTINFVPNYVQKN